MKVSSAVEYGLILRRVRKARHERCFACAPSNLIPEASGQIALTDLQCRDKRCWCLAFAACNKIGHFHRRCMGLAANPDGNVQVELRLYVVRDLEDLIAGAN